MDDYQQPQGPPRPATFDFTVIGEHGRVESTGVSSMLPPDLPGTLVLQCIAPADTYWDGAAFVPLGTPATPYEVYDWATHTWADRRTLADLKRSLTLLATEHRYMVETAGIEIGGLVVRTAPEDRVRLTAPLLNPARPRDSLLDFKAASGWVTLKVSDLQNLADAVDLYVQECFSAERRHHEAVARLDSLTAAFAYDLNSLWPSRQR